MKQCKDFGEVLVALGQGKTVINAYENQVKLEGDRLKYRNLDYGNESWNTLPSLVEEEFYYPAPIYEEPKTVEIDMWGNIYPDGTIVFLNTKEEADSFKDPDRIACIHIKRTVTEGEGLE